tara:strand:- start:10479 stop:11141 length:663 start_codon:yes stop_codon:yes gene_type:complete
MAKIFSNEDGNQNRSSRVIRERIYSDIDLSLEARISPTYSNGDGDILKKTDAASVKQALKNLLLTNRFEKPFRPNYGGNLGGLLFEMVDEDTADTMIGRIKAAVDRYEPRAKITNLKIVGSPDYNTISVVLEFRIVSSGVSDTLRIKLTETTTAAVVPPVTPPVDPDEIIKTEDNSRLLTLSNLLLRADELGIFDGAILTVPDGVQLLTQQEEVLLTEQV